MTWNRRSFTNILAAAALLVLTAAAFWGVSGAGGIALDDPGYVSANPLVQKGLTWDNLIWSFSTTCVGNWVPLTWVSHMLTVDLFGMDVTAHHLVNLACHLVAVLALFLFVARATGRPVAAALAAALFGVHPLRVESVAWISERKDVLSGVFWMLSLAGYVEYARRPGVVRYLVVSGLFVLALLSKPMTVTLPCVLLLLDWWPLGRVTVGDRGRTETGARRVFFEKVPLLLLAAAYSVWVYWWQSRVGVTVGDFPFALRVANALVTYVKYLEKTLWPSGLSFFYPFPEAVSAPQLGVAIALLLLATAAAWRVRNRQPWLIVGWLWYLGTLVPTLGLVQVGFQARADRYTYLPLAGIFLAGSLLLGQIARAGRWARGVSAAGAVLALGVLALLTANQVRHWRTSENLYRHALAVDGKNWFANKCFGDLSKARGDLAAATRFYEEAALTVPTTRRREIYLNLSTFYEQSGRSRDAAAARLKATVEVQRPRRLEQ